MDMLMIKIFYGQQLFEIIDLDQRVNFPLLYPVTFDVVADNRRPMLWWLRQEIEKGTYRFMTEEGFMANLTERKKKLMIFLK